MIPSAPRTRLGRATTVVLALQGAWVITYEIQMFRGMEAEGRFFGLAAWNIVVGAAVVLLLRRAWQERGRTRLAWTLLGVGSALWIAGDNYFTLRVQESDNTAAITWADVGYLSFVPLAVTGLAILAWVQRSDFHPALLLDGAAAAAAIAATSSGVVMRDVLDAYSGDRFDVVVKNAAYPVADALLIGVTVGAWAMRRWRLDSQWAWLGAGLVVFWLADSVFLVESARDTYTSPNVIDPGWTTAFVCLGMAATRRPRPTTYVSVWAQTFWPVAFAVLAMVMLIASSVMHLHMVGVILAGVACSCVLLRLTVTLRANNAMLEASVHEASTDHLTGLGNRRALFAALENGLASGEAIVLGLYDLDGFKAFNDSFGHPAGDALLARCGQVLAETVRGRGQAYRLGGDEFCVLSYAGPDVLAEAAEGLITQRDGYWIRGSYGAVHLPEEADTTSDAMRLADERMYTCKAARRPSAAVAGAEVVLELLAAIHPDHAAHGRRVSALCVDVATAAGWAPAVVEETRLVGLLREAGYLTAPDAGLAERTIRVVSAVTGLRTLLPALRASFPDPATSDAAPASARLVVLCDAFVRFLPDWDSASTRAVQDALEQVASLGGHDPAQFAYLHGVVTRSLASAPVPATL